MVQFSSDASRVRIVSRKRRCPARWCVPHPLKKAICVGAAEQSVLARCDAVTPNSLILAPLYPPATRASLSLFHALMVRGTASGNIHHAFKPS